jgi:hypothetical protein
MNPAREQESVHGHFLNYWANSRWRHGQCRSRPSFLQAPTSFGVGSGAIWTELLRTALSPKKKEKSFNGGLTIDHPTAWNGNTIMIVQLPIVVMLGTSTYGMGGTYDGVRIYRPPLVPGGDPAAHQLPGGSGSLPHTKVGCQGQKFVCFSATEVGQYLGRLLREQTRRDGLPKTERHC